MLNKVKMGLGIATVATGLALVPAIAPASATVSRVSAVSAVSSLRTSALCGDFKNQATATSKASGGALAKAYESGSWPSIQKALLSTYSAEFGSVNKLEQVLSGAPGNVKAAVSTFLKFDQQIKSAVQNSTSLTQFSTQIESLTESPKVVAALKTMTAYGNKVCPGSIPKTPTT